MKALTENSVIDLTENLTSIESLYGEQDLASSVLFAGGFINFGYWKNIKYKVKISYKTRALSSQRLYEAIFQALNLGKDDKIAEIGCGLGNGCVLLQKKYHPKFIVGIDSSPHQIERAIQKHKLFLLENADVKFVQAPAEDLPLKANSLTKVYSIEALQHFRSVPAFLESVFDVLRPNGKLIISTFFFLTPPDPEFFKMFPNFACGIDKVILIDKFVKMLKLVGFNNIRVQSIGKYVWQGFDKWINQTEFRDTWDRNWLTAYENGILDYFIIEAEKGGR